MKWRPMRGKADEAGYSLYLRVECLFVGKVGNLGGARAPRSIVRLGEAASALHSEM